MQYRAYGKDGPTVSCLGFGAMRLPLRYKKPWGVAHLAQSAVLIRAALSEGVNFIDSHHNYHASTSETAIGHALRGWKGHRVFIQTKTPWYRDEPRAYFERQLHAALEKLGVDCIDYLLHHSMTMPVWKKKGRQFLKFTDWAMKRGLILHRGFSSHDTPAHVHEFIDTGEFECMLVSYNWMDPQQRENIAYAAARGMGVSVMNPVGGGLLSTSTPQVLRLLPGAKSAAELSLRFALDTPGVAVALSGMSTPEQVAENVTACSRKQPMTPKQAREFAARLKKIHSDERRLCTGCGYCMPCPHGVDIPGNFRLLGRMRFFGQEETARTLYKHLKKTPKGEHSAEACRQCGECLPKCPIHVPITDQLKEVSTLLG